MGPFIVKIYAQNMTTTFSLGNSWDPPLINGESICFTPTPPITHTHTNTYTGNEDYVATDGSFSTTQLNYVDTKYGKIPSRRVEFLPILHLLHWVSVFWLVHSSVCVCVCVYCITYTSVCGNCVLLSGNVYMGAFEWVCRGGDLGCLRQSTYN